ncbi:Hpt domain-containing protein [Paraflavitalea sp. CAU 1676]|uniref:Hpt domain-containing protein n=1 Tax=Paraflavitalea sp. CAU 1676 TaxID=3032598 RepID=UPI0023DB3F26|nr:Hpt domain-containing protein [Paraflavitalea sp. CAU 1676]MDF2193699.1 Hpt domain-containing protein [Paraflavitalea sp. CAU 1676]
MSQSTLSKHFIFNEKLNSDYLFSLYADDYPYIEEVFSVTLQHFDEDADAIQNAYAAGSVADLKKGVHKMKPAFGFVGLTDIQQCCAEFEDACGRIAETAELKADYKQLMATLDEGKLILEAEYRKLKDFNANSL